MKYGRTVTSSILTASALAVLLGFAAAPVSATVTYNTWTSNESPNGNYIFTVTDTGTNFNYSLTVNPWNAEALGLFIDLGSADLPAPGSVPVTNVVTAPATTGTVVVYATDTTSDTCGEGCNLNGLTLPALFDGEWELVFSLGNQGYEGIQTFSWTTSDFGLSEAAFGVVGIRAQQLCLTGTLPDGTNCGGSDKVWGTGGGGGDDDEIPEPGVLFLMGAGLLGLGIARRRKSA